MKTPETIDLLRSRLDDVMASHIPYNQKMETLIHNGVAIDPDEPPLWHREGDSAWAIYLSDGKLVVATAKAADVDSRLLG